MMSKAEIRVFADLEHLSWAAATRLEELARIKALEKKTFTAALSGGSTPKHLYEILGSPIFAGRVRWQDVHLFQVDERCVPPDHPESNYRMIREAWLENCPLPETNFHRLAGEMPDREEACRQYAEVMARVLAPPAGAWPRLELIFLGLGPDGHTASLFPGSAALGEQTAWLCPNYVERFKGISPQWLARANHLRRALSTRPQSPGCCSAITQRCSNCTIEAKNGAWRRT